VRLANVRSGGLDLIEGVAPTDLEMLRQDPHLKLAAVNGLGYGGIAINVANGERAKTPIGQDARVRHALELSIDREALNQVAFDGAYQPGNQWVAPTNPYYVKELPFPARDVAKAKALLVAAGAPNPVLTMMVFNGSVAMQLAQVIQAMAKESGFDLHIQATEATSAYQHAANGDFEAFYGDGTDASTRTGTFPPSLGATRRTTICIIAAPRSIASSISRARSKPGPTGWPITVLQQSTSCRICRSSTSTMPNGCTHRPPGCRGSSLTRMA